MYIEKIASQIKNDIIGGLRGYHSNLSLNIEQLCDEVVATRLAILKEQYLKGVMPTKDLLLAINCIDVDCSTLERCPCTINDGDLVQHFEIPQLVSCYGKQSIDYIGSTDRMNSFYVLTSLSEIQNFKYRKRAKNKPYVWIDYSPNANGMLDCFLFNAPFVEQVSVVGIFKDPRQLNKYKCCNLNELQGADVNMSYIDQLVKDKLTKEKLAYYRQYQPQNKPNTQEYTTG